MKSKLWNHYSNQETLNEASNIHKSQHFSELQKGYMFTLCL